jgi:hypothetical protein
MNRIARPFSLRAPSSVPTTPPTTAATPHIGSGAGRVPMLAKFVDRATMAFTKMNATDTPAVWRISARPVSKSNRLSKRPPPTPVRPETIAVCTVIDRPAQLMHASHKRATRREEGLVGTQTGLTICNLRARMVNVPMKRPPRTCGKCGGLGKFNPADVSVDQAA